MGVAEKILQRLEKEKPELTPTDVRAVLQAAAIMHQSHAEKTTFERCWCLGEALDGFYKLWRLVNDEDGSD